MKSLASKLLLITILVIYSTTVALLVNPVRANWLWDLPDPTPEITILTPKNQSTYFTNQIPLTLTTTVPFGSDITASYLLDHQATIDMARSKIDGTEYSATLTSLSEGWHTLKVWAIGENHQGKSGMDIVSITFLVDVVAPIVSILSPMNETYNVFDLPLNFTISEKANWIGYGLDDKTPLTIAGNTTLKSLSEGMHSITVYANDTVGRKGSSETVVFSIEQELEELVYDQSEQTSTVTAVAVSFAVASVGASGAIIYLKKSKR